MLKSIEIKNFIFIQYARIELTKGFNVITGETGAGKSIFLNALSITLGHKIPSDIIRMGENKTEVTSIFHIHSRPQVFKKIVALGITLTDEQLMLKREMNKNGKSKCFIAGQPTSLQNFKSIAKNLIDIHSQHQNLNLLKPLFYISYLDRFLSLESNLISYRKTYFEFLKIKKELVDLLQSVQKLKNEKEYLNFTIKELSGKIVSEEEYQKLKDKLKISEKKQNDSQNFADLSWQIKDQVLLGIKEVNQLLEKLDFADPQINQNYIRKNLKIFDYFKNLENTLKIRKPSGGFQEEIDAINVQLSHLENLKRKYGTSLDQLDDKLKQAQAKLNHLAIFNKEQKQMELLKKRLLNQVIKNALALHLLRKKGIPFLVEKIESHIAEMGMESSKIDFSFSKEKLSFEKNEEIEEYINENGFDKINFNYAAAQESNFKPLKEIASGGEISRIMLALKVILAKKIPNQTIVFDEIDAGVGGETAIKVGEKIKKLAMDKQVLVISHLPQIAKFAHSHFKVEKLHREKTEVKISQLQGEEVVQEISRMLGNKKSLASLELAKEFINR